MEIEVGMSGTWGPSASHLPIMSAVAGFGLNGPQRMNANIEPLHITAAPTFSTRAKQPVAGCAHRRSLCADWVWEEASMAPLSKYGHTHSLNKELNSCYLCDEL